MKLRHSNLIQIWVKLLVASNYLVQTQTLQLKTYPHNAIVQKQNVIILSDLNLYVGTSSKHVIKTNICTLCNLL
jgi:hypothetical protein